MTDSSLHEDVSGSENFPQDDKLVVRWIEEQPISQAWLARTHFNKLLDQAAQPRHVSGNACIKLCHFIEQCRTSSSPAVRDVACSKKTCLDLFNFYVDWNEKNQHRSMRQVLELVASILSSHPEEFICNSVKSSILHQSISIITHQASQPLVKPAFKSLECFLSKGTISTAELESAYKQLGSSESAGEISAVPKSLTSWDSFVSDVFDWMTLPDISPAAGKFLVTLFRELSKSDTKTGLAEQTYLWQRWIHNGLSKHPDALENIKYYLFPPLFKLDRAGSLVFLEDLNTQKPISDLKSQDLNAYSFLQLAALEAGKKAGLVEEPDTIQFQKASKKSGKYITIHEDVIGVVMAHNSSSVRSLAFSLLVSSSSSIRPFSSTALDILQENLSQLYADTDARFRNEVLTNTKNMIERLRGATASLVREIENLASFVNSDRKAQDTGNPSAIEAQKRDVSPIKQMNPEFLEKARKVLGRHESFLEWYIELLMGEIIPTSSYQRHITALKAISLLLRSGIHEATSGSLATKISDNSTVWPYTIKFFTSRAMRLLLDLLMDPFEDVRSSATEILKLASPDCFTLTPLSRRPSHPGSPRRPSSSKDGSPKQVRRRPSQADILEAFTRETTEMWSARPLGLLMDFIARAEGVSKRTGRADYADGVARAYELLYGLLDTSDGRIGLVEDLVQQLERKVSIAENDLARAVLVAPVHGSFAALCFVWEVIDKSNHTRRYSMDLATIEESCETWDNLQWRMLSACARIWETVKDVLCNDSPEGHLPNDLDDMDDIDTKDILSYSFRATHESSNLLRAMVSKIKSQWQNGTPILPSGLFADVGNLTFNQLASLRHRGAFSTVSLTFSKCCQLVQYQSPEEKLVINLLEEWYQGALGCIFDQASTTRRSAGIPALLTGILSANAATPAFQDVMTELKALAGQRVQLSETDETKLPQVHATNCLKEIFKSSSLGKRAEAHIADCLQLAADSLNSEIWAIRNCGLILLRSLIDCLFGTSESKLATEAGWDGRSIRISYDKYPALPELLLKLLDTETGGGDSLGKPVLGAVESVFPALDIIRRAGPPDGRREQIRKSVSVHLGSKVWHIREIAARTMCTLLLHDGWLSDMEVLLDTCDSSTNRLHGVLMTTKFVLKRRQVLGLELTTENFKDLRVLLSRTREEFPSFHQCPDVFSALFEVETEVLKSALHIRDRGANAITQEIVDDLVPPESHVFYENLIVKYSRSSSNLAPHRTSVSSALLRNAIARKAIFAAALTSQSHILRIVIKNGKEDTDLILAALECIPYAWKSVTSPQALKVVCDVYIETIKVCVSSEVRSVAVMNLAEVFDKLFTSGESYQLLAGELASLGKILGSHTGSPQLSNAEIRISGSILLDEYLQQAQDASEMLQRRLEAWGEMISTAGDSHNDFDTRAAASAALNSFYINRQGLNFSPCFLASILALYDTLNDDDDEIREDAALTVSSLIGKSLVPLTAAKELLQYLWQKFRSSKSFARSVVCRITGNQDQSLGHHNLQLRTAEVQFAHAMADDDSLFIIEEQNLFIDEVRETKLWAGLFEKTLDSSWNDSATVLAAWVLDGLYTMKTLVAKSDAPLGWASKPSVFAQCMRVIICANSLLASSQVNSSGPNPEQQPGSTYYIQPPIIDKIASDLESLILLSADKQLHESFISEILGPQPLVLTRKDAHRLAKVTSRKKTALVKHREYQQSQQHHERPQPSFRPTSYDRRLSNHSSRSLDQRNQSPQNLKSP